MFIREAAKDTMVTTYAPDGTTKQLPVQKGVAFVADVISMSACSI